MTERQKGFLWAIAACILAAMYVYWWVSVDDQIRNGPLITKISMVLINLMSFCGTVVCIVFGTVSFNDEQTR